MSKIFEVDYRTGSFIDNVGGLNNIATPLTGKLLTESKGIGYKMPVNSIDASYTPVYNLSGSFPVLSIIIWAKLSNRTNQFAGNALFSCRDTSSLQTGNDGFMFGEYISNNIELITKPFVRSTLESNGFNTLKNKYCHFVLVYINGKVLYFRNGVLRNTVILTGYSNLTFSRIGIDSFYNVPGASYSNSGIFHKCSIYNHSISKKEIDTDYQSFLNSRPSIIPTQFRPNLNTFKPKVINEPGLVAAYNFKPSGNKLINIAAPNAANGWNPSNVNTSVLIKYQLYKEGLATVSRSPWETTKSTIVSWGNNQYLKKQEITILGRIKYLKSQGTGVIYGINPVFLIRCNALIITGSLSSVNYASLPTLGLITTGVYTTFCFYYKSGVGGGYYVNGIKIVNIPNIGNIQWGNGNINLATLADDGRYTEACLYNDLRIYSKVLSDFEIKSYHNSFIKPVLVENFNYPVNATRFGNWLSEINNITIKEVTSKAITNSPKIGTKYLSTLIADKKGLLPCNVAYGTWEFDFLSPAGNTSEVGIGIINSQLKQLLGNTTTYVIYFLAGNNLRFYRGGGVVVFNLGTWVTNKWYHFKITRDTSGKFSFWIDNQFKGTVVDNTITTCASIILHRPIGLTAIKVTPGITV